MLIFRKYVLLFGILVVFNLFYACDKKDFTATPELIIKLKVKSAHNGRLELFYTDQSNTEFSEDNKEYFLLKSDSNFQPVDFKINSKKIIQKFRFDFPTNAENSIIKIKDLQLIHKGKEIDFDNQDLNLLFTPNDYTQELEDGKYLLQSKNNRFDPYLTTTPFFAQRLKIEF